MSRPPSAVEVPLSPLTLTLAHPRPRPRTHLNTRAPCHARPACSCAPNLDNTFRDKTDGSAAPSSLSSTRSHRILSHAAPRSDYAPRLRRLCSFAIGNLVVFRSSLRYNSSGLGCSTACHRPPAFATALRPPDLSSVSSVIKTDPLQSPVPRAPVCWSPFLLQDGLHQQGTHVHYHRYPCSLLVSLPRSLTSHLNVHHCVAPRAASNRMLACRCPAHRPPGLLSTSKHAPFFSPFLFSSSSILLRANSVLGTQQSPSSTSTTAPSELHAYMTPTTAFVVDSSL